MAEAIEPTTPRPFLEFRPLLRAPKIASDARKLILGSAGLLALYVGWFALDLAFGEGAGSRQATNLPVALFEGLPDASKGGFFDGRWQVFEPFWTIVSPFVALFTRGIGFSGWFHSALKALWAAVAWGIAGGAIARVAVVEAAADRRIGVKTALRFALGKSASLIGAPLTPMLAVAILSGCCAFFGLLYRIPAGIGAVIATTFGFLPLLLGLVMALILVGLALGWPLMHATVAAEGEDAPDALSRSYSYVNQRLARYAAHVVVALVIGSVAFAAVVAFAQVVLALAGWGVSLGAPDLGSLDGLAASGRLFWDRVVGLVVMAWAYSYFWSAASIIYLILRRDVDGTPWHDVYLPEHDADTFAGDPPIEKLSATEVDLKESAPAATSAP